MGSKFETYELTPPRIWLWRIQDVHDLVEIAESCNLHAEQESFRYYTQGYDYRAGRNTLERVGKLRYNDKYGLHYESYHSAYGNSTDTHYHRVADLGGALVLNLTIKMGVFLTGLGSDPLSAQSLPEEMVRPHLIPVDLTA